jgi:hypothetical protein
MHDDNHRKPETSEKGARDVQISHQPPQMSGGQESLMSAEFKWFLSLRKLKVDNSFAFLALSRMVAFSQVAKRHSGFTMVYLAGPRDPEGKGIWNRAETEQQRTDMKEEHRKYRQRTSKLRPPDLRIDEIFLGDELTFLQLNMDEGVFQLLLLLCMIVSSCIQYQHTIAQF